MLDKIRAAITVLNKGEELTHKEAWKNATTLINILVALLGAVAVFLPDTMGLSDSDIATLASAVAIVVGMFSGYTTVGTSTTVGLPQRRTSSDNRDDDHTRLSDNVSDGSA